MRKVLITFLKIQNKAGHINLTWQLESNYIKSDDQRMHYESLDVITTIVIDN